MDLRQIVELYDVLSEQAISLNDILIAADDESTGRKCWIAFPF